MSSLRFLNVYIIGLSILSSFHFILTEGFYFWITPSLLLLWHILFLSHSLFLIFVMTHKLFYLKSIEKSFMAHECHGMDSEVRKEHTERQFYSSTRWTSGMELGLGCKCFTHWAFLSASKPFLLISLIPLPFLIIKTKYSLMFFWVYSLFCCAYL